MSIFTTLGHKHLYRIQDTKKLSMGKEVLKFEPNEVFVPVVDPGSSKPIQLNVSIGDLVKEGQVIGTCEKGTPVFAPVSGKIVREETMFHAGLGRNVRHFAIENDKKHQKVEPLEVLDLKASAEQIVERMKESGLSGQGGAGFPTYIKYLGALEKNIDTILINGVECEPFLTTDHEAMLLHKDELIHGIEFMMKAAGAKDAYIVYKKGYPDLDECYKDIESINPSIHVAHVKNVYPAGWERFIVKAVLKRTYDKLPAEAHTIVNNVTTAIMLARAMNGEVETHKVITVSGSGVSNPSNVDVPIYTRAVDIVEFLGGYVGESVSVSFGGPMCSRGVMDDKAVILPYYNGLTILPRMTLNTLPCLRCGACTDHCPVGLQPVEIKDAYQAKDSDRMMALTPWHCIGCGLCSYICPSKIDVNDFVKKAKLMTSIKLKQLEAQKKEGKK